MDNTVFCGIEVSAQELVVAWTGKKGELVMQRFANSAAGHRGLSAALTRGKRRACTGWTWPCF